MSDMTAEERAKEFLDGLELAMHRRNRYDELTNLLLEAEQAAAAQARAEEREALLKAANEIANSGFLGCPCCGGSGHVDDAIVVLRARSTD